MSKRRLGRLCGALPVAFCWAVTAQAAVIEYSATSLGGDTWQYDYVVDNSDGAVAFDEFSIYFTPGEATSFLSFAAPAGWDVFLAQPDPALPDGGFFDALSLGGDVLAGSVLPGFSLVFTAGTGFVPGVQAFDLIASDTFDIVYSGFTSRAQTTNPDPDPDPNPDPVQVPEPESLALLLAGLGLLATSRRAGRDLRMTGPLGAQA